MSTSKDHEPAKETDAGAAADTESGGKKRTDKDVKKDEKVAKRAERKQKGKAAGQKVKAGSDAIRSRIASVVWLIAVACALFLAVGALLIALDAQLDNTVAAFILDVAGVLDGPLARQDGLFDFAGKNAETKDALVNWGIAAIAYLVVGKILDRVIRP